MNEKQIGFDLNDMAKDLFGAEPPAEEPKETCATEPVEETTAEEAAVAEEPVTETAVTEEAAAEEAPTEETPVEEASVAEEAPVVGVPEGTIPLDEYKTALDEHFQNLRSLIKYTKTKDENIYKLSSELQKYREDYCKKTFKSIATLLISYREDCRRSLVDLNTFELTLDKAKKFMSFLCDDYEELLSNVGCEEDDGVWSFNGKPLSGEERNPVKFPPLFEMAPEKEESAVDLSGATVQEILLDAEAKIKAALADNETVDKCLKEYSRLATVIEDDIVLLCVYPAIRKLISLYGKTKRMIEQAIEELNEENMRESYAMCLAFLINHLEDILLSGGVRIDTTADDMFDTKKNRLIKAIVTSDSALDRKIAKQYTECYTMNETVIYPAKVDVYKYQA
ncbi:MAG: nucleotide exchange factor GrpE [Clostridia bacterium]|nr:nucleotide exchange factor GrpE [Clostridia bacterium]